MKSIYVVAHKSFELNKKLDSCYKIIRVGGYAKELSNELSDSTGDNIASKNPNYCELTAMYWIWKNDHDSDVVGLCHYRRYFIKSILSTDPEHFINSGDIDMYLKKCDVIVPRKEYSYRGSFTAYLDCGHEKDLLVTREAIETLYPEYLPYYESEFVDSSGNYVCNMVITSKSLYDDYCKWLFDILTYVESRVDISAYSKEEARIFGYISERLLGVWIKKNKLRAKELRIVNTEDDRGATFYIKDFLKSIGIYQGLKQLIFSLTHSKKRL